MRPRLELCTIPPWRPRDVRPFTRLGHTHVGQLDLTRESFHRLRRLFIAAEFLEVLAAYFVDKLPYDIPDRELTRPRVLEPRLRGCPVGRATIDFEYGPDSCKERQRLTPDRISDLLLALDIMPVGTGRIVLPQFRADREGGRVSGLLPFREDRDPPHRRPFFSSPLYRRP